jgi:hypothetical protein
VEPWAQAVLAVCAVAVSAAVVYLLLEVRRVAARADRLLALVEREVLPMAGEAAALLAEVRGLSQRVGKDLERVGAIVERADEASAQVARLAQAVGGFTRVGQVAGLLIGLRRGTDVFVKRLKQP